MDNVIVILSTKIRSFMQTAFRVLLLFFMVCLSAWSAIPPSPWYSQDADKNKIITIELFVSSTCPYCKKAEAFFQKIEPNSPWLRVQRHVINQDKNALIQFNQLLTEQKMNDFAVPSIFFCNSRWVGFDSDDTTGKALLDGIRYCKQHIEQEEELSAATIDVLKRWANANLFNSAITENPSAVRYIISVTFMDVFNPCALFGITAFFAVLFLQEQRKNQVITGLLFIITIGVVHYLQQAQANIFFQLLPWLRIPASLIGLFILYWVWLLFTKRNTSVLGFLAVFLFAFMVQTYQQTCVMNWSYIFQQWLYNQHLSNVERAFYQLLYQSIYILPLVITLILYLLLTKSTRFVAWVGRLISTSLVYLALVALFLFIYPGILSSLGVSLATIVLAIIGGMFINNCFLGFKK